MTQNERDVEISELRIQKEAQEQAISELSALDIPAEIGETPTLESVDAVRQKIRAIAIRADSAKGGGKLSRTETVTVRLDPKLRYLAELAARMHRRTLSSYIEWAIKASLDTEVVRPTNMPSMVASDTTIGSEAEYLWDVDDADRFVKLAMRYPHLLTHEEQVRWKLIREMPGLWRGHWRGSPKEWHWTVDEDSIVLDQLRAHWMELCAIADGGTPRANLPRWLRVRTSPVESDDDFPF